MPRIPAARDRSISQSRIWKLRAGYLLALGVSFILHVKCAPLGTGAEKSGDSRPESQSKLDAASSFETGNEKRQATIDSAHRKEDFECAFRLGRLYSATRNINFNIAGRERGQIPAQYEVRAFLGSSKLVCLRQKGKRRTSYFVATSGPTPCNHPAVLAYEVRGNHGSWRHVLYKTGDVISVTEDEWAQMRKNGRYYPEVLPILLAFSEMMNPIHWAEPEALKHKR